MSLPYIVYGIVSLLRSQVNSKEHHKTTELFFLDWTREWLLFFVFFLNLIVSEFDQTKKQ